jgi:hypothetical protein
VAIWQLGSTMITVVGYKDGRPCRHEQCYDIWSADQKADEMKECDYLYDHVEIVISEEQNGKT